MMKIKPGFILGQIVGQNVVLPPDEMKYEYMITLNDSGKVLWSALENGAERDDLVAVLLAAYEIDKQTAMDCVDAFISKLRENGFLE